MGSQQTSRREFLRIGVATVACAGGGCGGSGARKPSVVAKPTGGRLYLSVAQSAPLFRLGGSLLVQPEGTHDKIIVVNHHGSFSALSAICTHMGCTINYDQKIGRMHCPCHGSEFGLDGGNLKGPAKRPLKQYAVTMENGQLVIAL